MLVVGVIAGAAALSGGFGGRQAPEQAATGPAGVPRYYVALTGSTDHSGLTAPAAAVRGTGTGAVLARLVPPRPYVAFTGVTGSTDDRTFVLSAQAKQNRDQTEANRFFVLHLSPAGRPRLQALPSRYVPAGGQISGMALSADGTRLAATIGAAISLEGNRLYVFNLATGARRTWDSPGFVGPGSAEVNVGSLAWTADNRTLSFIWLGIGPVGVRLLRTGAHGSNLLADSRPVVTVPDGPGSPWSEAFVTPDGKTIIGVRQLSTQRLGGVTVRQELVRYSVATGAVTGVLNHLRIYRNYESVQWTSDSGQTLVVTGTRPGASAGIIRGRRYTPIPWSAGILAAAW